jgi:hypothetical protein
MSAAGIAVRVASSPAALSRLLVSSATIAGVARPALSLIRDYHIAVMVLY